MKSFFLSIIVVASANLVFAQTANTIDGIICLKGANQRLSNISIYNKTNGLRAVSNDIGIFKIRGKKGDSVIFTSTDFQQKDTVIANAQTLVVYLQKASGPIVLDEVTINATSLKQDILQTKKIYRSKGVFYTGRPHYYYLFLKPMTFIYENFKSEVIAARKFKKIAANDLEGQEIGRHFNRDVVKSAVPALQDDQVDDFLVDYWPTIKQVRSWNYYEMIQYIQRSYKTFDRQSINVLDSGQSRNFDWGG